MQFFLRRAGRSNPKPSSLNRISILTLIGSIFLGLPLAASAATPNRHVHGTAQENLPYSAAVTSFETSLGGNGWHYVTTTVHFQNVSDKPIILGYDSSHVGVTDDQGNKYGLLGSRGIGAVAGNNVDTKFRLAPKTGGDALFDLRWRGERNAVFGVTFDLDLTARLILPTEGGQYKLGGEHPLAFTGLKSGYFVQPDGAPPISDHSVDAGPFTAKVTRSRVVVSGNRRWTSTEMTISFTNTTDKPLILAYEGESSFGTDEQGNRYGYGTPGTHDTSFSGIGAASGSSADPQFVLAPGESRDARFAVARRLGKEVGGTKLTYYVALEQLEILPSKQIRVVRQISLTFPGLPASN